MTDTVTEAADWIESIAEFGLLVSGIFGGLAHIADDVLGFVAQFGGALAGIKIASYLYDTAKLHNEMKKYEKGDLKHRREEKARYAEMLGDTLSDLGGAPIPDELRNEIVSFYQQEINDAETFRDFVGEVQNMRNQVQKRKWRGKMGDKAEAVFNKMQDAAYSKIPLRLKAYDSEEESEAYRVVLAQPYFVY